MSTYLVNLCRNMYLCPIECFQRENWFYNATVMVYLISDDNYSRYGGSSSNVIYFRFFTTQFILVWKNPTYNANFIAIRYR